MLVNICEHDEDPVIYQCKHTTNYVALSRLISELNRRIGRAESKRKRRVLKANFDNFVKNYLSGGAAH